jgi:hypothetical protein
LGMSPKLLLIARLSATIAFRPRASAVNFARVRRRHRAAVRTSCARAVRLSQLVVCYCLLACGLFCCQSTISTSRVSELAAVEFAFFAPLCPTSWTRNCQYLFRGTLMTPRWSVAVVKAVHYCSAPATLHEAVIRSRFRAQSDFQRLRD